MLNVIAFLREENRTLKAQLGSQRLRLNNGQRRPLAVGATRTQHAARSCDGRHARHLLRWHRGLIARKWTYARRRPGRPGLLVEIRRLVVRITTDNPSWGYTRIQGDHNLGHRVRSTIASVLKAEVRARAALTPRRRIPPSREPPTAWRAFLRALWPALVAADFLTTEVWTVRGLVTTPSFRSSCSHGEFTWLAQRVMRTKRSSSKPCVI